MNERAVAGTYADFKIVKTRNVAQMIIEIPLENGNDVVSKFGLPDPHTEKWVAVAMLQTNLINRNDQANKAIQAAGILCQSKQFGRYLKEQVGLPEVDPDVPSTIEDGLRAMLGVKSRTELHTNADAIKAFYRIEGEYKSWAMT